MLNINKKEVKLLFFKIILPINSKWVERFVLRLPLKPIKVDLVGDFSKNSVSLGATLNYWEQNLSVLIISMLLLFILLSLGFNDWFLMFSLLSRWPRLKLGVSQHSSNKLCLIFSRSFIIIGKSRHEFYFLDVILAIITLNWWRMTGEKPYWWLLRISSKIIPRAYRSILKRLSKVVMV